MRVIRCIAAGLWGFLLGGAIGFGLTYVFINTAFQRMLGQRFPIFDGFGVFVVALLSAIIACFGGIVVTAISPRKLRAVVNPRIALPFTVAPALFAFSMTFFGSGDWAWLGLIHLSACSGTLAVAGWALVRDYLSQSQ